MRFPVGCSLAFLSMWGFTALLFYARTIAHTIPFLLGYPVLIFLSLFFILFVLVGLVIAFSDDVI